MAEATGEVATNENKVYYCHQCSREISPKLPEFVCPTCDSGFIEEVTEEFHGENVSPGAVPSAGFPHPFSAIFGGSFRGDDDEPLTDSEDEMDESADHQALSPFQRTRISVRTIGPGGGSMSAEGQQAFQGLLETLLMGIAGGAQGRGGGNTFTMGALGPGQMGMFNFPAGNMFVTGNPGDYAWGPGGMDAIITQLMNQLEGTGPPPASKDNIENLPKVHITHEHVEKHLQCSVCFEYYNKDEPVRLLPCQHMFHTDCIVPWLELHGTCPVCRKNLEGQDTSCDQNTQSIPETLENFGIDPASIDTTTAESAAAVGAAGSSSNGAAASTGGGAGSTPSSSTTAAGAGPSANTQQQQPSAAESRLSWQRPGNQQPSNNHQDPSTQLDQTQAPRDTLEEYD